MAETRKVRSGIRIKSSERKKSAGKPGSASSRPRSQEEEEEKESLAWKVLSEEQTVALRELTVHELEAKLAEILSIENHHICLPEACLLDYYVAGFWFAKEQKFSTQQISAFFTLLKIMLENVKEKHLSLVESIKVYKSLMAGIGVENSPKSGGLECFDVSQAKTITDYISDSLFQHYKLYQFAFTQESQEQIISTQLTVEVPPLANFPFPPPLDEGMTEEMWREHVMTPPPSPTPEITREEEETPKTKGLSSVSADEIKADNILASMNPEDVKKVVKKVAGEVLGNFKAEMDCKFKDREAMFTSKINRQNPR